MYFSLVVDVFHRILHKAQNDGFLKGIGNFGDLGSILNLYFADDTFMFLEASLENIQALKLLLLEYEDISGTKINFHKYELVPLNLSEEE
jgi:hypothetical protein